MKPLSQLLRGRFYSTHLTARCAEYHRCILCGGCRRYDGNNLTCRNCERFRAAPPCSCKPSSLLAARMVTAKLGYEMAHADMPRQSKVVTLEEDAQTLQFIEENIGNVVDNK